jgi:glycosyltransferase involved in cell wall biosynthesis
VTTLRINYLMYRAITHDGYGRYALSQIKALARAGVDVYPEHVTALEAPGWMLRLKGLDFSRLTIALMPPHELKALPARQWLSTMYEGTGLPDDWARHVNEKAERVIVPCEWLVEVFRENGVLKRVPIDVVPGGVDPEEFPVLDFPVPDHRPYTFLSFGDRGSRKGSDLAWQAFYRAFGDCPDVRLVVKTLAGGLPELTTARIKDDAGNIVGDPRISLWRETSDSLADVFSLVDCFVYPTRGEGWGLPPREAACMGLPVICTRYGGTAVGIDEWAVPINTLRPVHSRLRGGGQWAEPDVEEVAHLMRWCYEHRDEAKQKGLQAARWLRANQTWAQSAQALIALLEMWG